jgi:hypothetical protein
MVSFIPQECRVRFLDFVRVFGRFPDHVKVDTSRSRRNVKDTSKEVLQRYRRTTANASYLSGVHVYLLDSKVMEGGRVKVTLMVLDVDDVAFSKTEALQALHDTCDAISKYFTRVIKKIKIKIKFGFTYCYLSQSTANLNERLIHCHCWDSNLRPSTH